MKLAFSENPKTGFLTRITRRPNLGTNLFQYFILAFMKPINMTLGCSEYNRIFSNNIQTKDLSLIKDECQNVFWFISEKKMHVVGTN